MKSNFKVFLKGIIDVSPLMIPVVPFGLIFGVLAIDIGFTPIETMAMSLIIFGGASQIVLLQLFKMAGYGFIRFSLGLFPSASEVFTPLIYTLSVIAIIFRGSFISSNN